MKTCWAKQRNLGNRDGSAVIVVITLLAILLIYTMGNVRTLDLLGRDLRLLDQKQRHAWAEVEISR